MKKNILNRALIASAAAMMSLGVGCNAYFDKVESLTKVEEDMLFESENGIRTLVAELYNAMPMEDFNYHPNDNSGETGDPPYRGFYVRGVGSAAYFATTDMYTDDAILSDGGSPIGQPGNDYFSYAYNRLRNVNLFLENIVTAYGNGVVKEDAFKRLQGEAYFVRAYIYFGLVKRYGGVPLLTEPLDDIYIPGTDNLALYIPRSTEKQTWDFVLDDLDKAIANLDVKYDSGLRANKMVAYALKSRVALHAASIAKYWNEAPLTGEAVSKGLVGMASSEANRYYQMCIEASQAVIDSGQYSLYGATPATKAEAQQNFRDLFLKPNSEFIFWREYQDGSIIANQGHSYDTFYSPHQKHPGWLRYGRHNPTLDIVDVFEDYTDDGTGKSSPVVTREDGNESFYYTHPNNVQLSVPFRKYDTPFEPFAGKDVRLLASILVPGSDFRGTTIVMQGGMVRSDGSVVAYTQGNETKNGKTYYALGAENATDYSGFGDVSGPFENANFSNTGFSVLKYLSAGEIVVTGGTAKSTTPWIDFRLAEIYLNYAEAVAESGQGDAGLAGQYLNALRRRAAHTDNIPLTTANVLKERRVEMAFEGRRYDDMLRRREYHKFWNMARRHALVPMVDLRDAEAKYIFVRVNQYHDERDGGRQFNPVNYYKAIPGTATNGLIQNPGQ